MAQLSLLRVIGKKHIYSSSFQNPDSLPSVQRLESQSHSIPRLRGYDTSGHRHLIQISHFHMEAAAEYSNQSFQLRLCKLLADATSWPMKERQVCIIACYATGIVVVAILLNPMLRAEIVSIRAP